MLRIQQALCDYLAAVLTGVTVTRAYVLDTVLETIGDDPIVLVIPGEASSGRVGKPGEMIQTSRGTWQENYNFEVTYLKKVVGQTQTDLAEVQAEKIFPLFNQLNLSDADAFCIGADKPRPYIKRGITEGGIYIAPHVAAFRRDYISGR